MKKLLTVPTILLIVLLSIPTTIFTQECRNGLTLYGNTPVASGSATFGRYIYNAGDVDNDGLPDILITSNAVLSVSSKATVYSGLTGDSIRTYFDDYNTIRGSSGFGFFNDDQYADILVNGVVYSGLTGDTLANYNDVALYGISAGDLNNDGKHDIIIPDRNWSNTIGRVDVISGANGDTLYSWTGGNYTAGWYGHSVAVAGDVDGDGTNDIVIGQPMVYNNGAKKGRIEVRSGKTGFRLFYRMGLVAGQEFGDKVAGAGDLNNDGYDDILVASHSRNSSASLTVWAYSGKDGSLLYNVYTGEANENYFSQYGQSMDGIGDIDNDGYDDFAVGAYRYSRYSRNHGNVYIYSGIDGSLLMKTSDYTQHPLEQFGSSICGLGDTDGDGSPDFAIGAVWGRIFGDPSNQYRGAVYIYKCPVPTDATEQIVGELPHDFKLQQNYPNPFNPQTTFEFSLSVRSYVLIEIFNVAGQRVRTLSDENKSAGQYQVIWEGDDANGRKVSSGIYFYRFTADDFTETKKMLLLK